MRVVFYVYLCLLLLCAGQPVYAGTHNSHSHSSPTKRMAKKLQVKLTSSDAGDTQLDDADLDADDDYKSHLDEDGGNHQFLFSPYTLTFAGNMICAVQLLSTHYNKRFKILPSFCGNSSPIYITQRVLRV